MPETNADRHANKDMDVLYGYMCVYIHVFLHVCMCMMSWN